MSLAVPGVVFIVAMAMTISSAIRISAPVMTSAWLMPLLLGIALAAIAGILLATELRGVRRNDERAKPDDSQEASPWRVAAWLVLSAGYAFLTPWVGFELSTIVFLVVALFWFGRANWMLTIPVALAVAFILPFVFRHVFFTLVP